MRPRSRAARKAADAAATALAVLAAAAGTAVLFWIMAEVFARGASVLGPAFFTRLPAPPGVGGGGLANAVLGTVIITLLATLMAVPPGVLAGVYLAEFAGNGRFASAVRFGVNMLMGVPSIIMGLFVWGTVVIATGGFSAWAGAVSLALIMLPVVARTAEDMLRLVPDSLRESVLAMGAPYWRAMLVIFLAARNGLVTGVLLAVARVGGETAPLLFTALNSPYWPTDLTKPTANLPVTIYNYAMSPYRDWQAMAWGASLVITAGVLALSLVSRFALKTGTERKAKR